MFSRYANFETFIKVNLALNIPTLYLLFALSLLGLFVMTFLDCPFLFVRLEILYFILYEGTYFTYKRYYENIGKENLKLIET